MNVQTEQPVSNTIYINNLNEKIKQLELRKALRAIFKQFGNILDIVIMSDYKMRGQAFVVFQESSSAYDALVKMRGFPFCGKPMRIDFAKSKSDAVAKIDGSYVERPKKRKAGATTGAAAGGDESDKPIASKPKMQRPQTSSYIARSVTSASALPNKILFVENLPLHMEQQYVSSLFMRFEGFVEVRMVPTRPGLAFAEFVTEVAAAVAMTALQGYNIDEEHPIRITYAKH